MDTNNPDQVLYQSLLSCIDSLSSPKTLCWDTLPELDLYMDQVIVFMERHLALFGDGRDKLLTPSMVNNYVKLGLIPPPVKKKYNREHLSRLTAICILKSLLPIPVISYLSDTCAESAGQPAAFDQLIQVQQAALAQAAQQARCRIQQAQASEGQEGCRQSLARLALDLAAQANASRVLAEKIALLLQQQEQAEKAVKKQ